MNNQSIYIERLTQATDEMVSVLNNLMRQLSPELGNSITLEGLQKILNSPDTYLYLAKSKEDGKIAGTLTLVIYSTPSATRGYIEDVVVDEKFRGLKIGEKLMQKGIDKAKELGLLYIGLTSKPERVAANHLYKKLGFVKRDTNVYRLILQ